MFASLLFMYAVLALVLGGGYLLRRLIKRHITWPRTGYVAYGREGKSKWDRMITTQVLSGQLAT